MCAVNKTTREAVSTVKGPVEVSRADDRLSNASPFVVNMMTTQNKVASAVKGPVEEDEFSRPSRKPAKGNGFSIRTLLVGIATSEAYK